LIIKKTLISILSIFLIFSACRKDEINREQTNVPVGTSIVESALSGQVIDENGKPIKDVMVTLNGIQQTTNDDGYFGFPRMALVEFGAFLVIENASYFTNYKRIIPNGNKTFTKIGLIKKENATGNFVASSGGTVSKIDAEKVIFNPNTIVDESGQPYSGVVTVYSHHFDPENPNLVELMPGNLSGIDANSDLVQLVTYSMVMVELEGANGQPLNLKEGTTATIEFPLKGEAANTAPDEIPLWSMDESNGIWVEEGIATKDGKLYRGTVGHFSFWNCDIPFTAVNLSGRIINDDGVPFPNVKVVVSLERNGESAHAYTNSEGYFSGKVPANQNLKLKVISNCLGIESEQNIGAFSADKKLDDIVAFDQEAIIITGNGLNCDSTSIENGYVIMEINNENSQIFELNETGDFQVNTLICPDAEVSIYVMNANGDKRSFDYSFTYTGQAIEKTGTHISCGNIDEYIVYKSGEEVFFEDDLLVQRFLDNQRNNFVAINWLFNPNPDVRFTFLYDPLIDSFNISVQSTDAAVAGFYFLTPTKFDDFVGGYVEGRAEGVSQRFIRVDPGNQFIFAPEKGELFFKLKIDQVIVPIQGTIWNDLNKNGLREASEPPIEGAQVTINSTTDTTNIDGHYNHSLSITENNVLEIIPPAGFSISPQNVGNDDSIDSDFDPINNTLNNPTITPNGLNTFDCGLYEN